MNTTLTWPTTYFANIFLDGALFTTGNPTPTPTPNPQDPDNTCEFASPTRLNIPDDAETRLIFAIPKSNSDAGLTASARAAIAPLQTIASQLGLPPGVNADACNVALAQGTFDIGGVGAGGANLGLVGVTHTTVSQLDRTLPARTFRNPDAATGGPVLGGGLGDLIGPGIDTAARPDPGAGSPQNPVQPRPIDPPSVDPGSPPQRVEPPPPPPVVVPSVPQAPVDAGGQPSTTDNQAVGLDNVINALVNVMPPAAPDGGSTAASPVPEAIAPGAAAPPAPIIAAPVTPNTGNLPPDAQVAGLGVIPGAVPIAPAASPGGNIGGDTAVNIIPGVIQGAEVGNPPPPVVAPATGGVQAAPDNGNQGASQAPSNAGNQPAAEIATPDTVNQSAGQAAAQAPPDTGRQPAGAQVGPLGGIASAIVAALAGVWPGGGVATPPAAVIAAPTVGDTQAVTAAANAPATTPTGAGGVTQTGANGSAGNPISFGPSGTVGSIDAIATVGATIVPDSGTGTIAASGGSANGQGNPNLVSSITTRSAFDNGSGSVNVNGAGSTTGSGPGSGASSNTGSPNPASTSSRSTASNINDKNKMVKICLVGLLIGLALTW